MGSDLMNKPQNEACDLDNHWRKRHLPKSELFHKANAPQAFMCEVTNSRKTKQLVADDC